jgi:hypothetical protein
MACSERLFNMELDKRQEDSRSRIYNSLSYLSLFILPHIFQILEITFQNLGTLSVSSAWNQLVPRRNL